MRYVPLFIPSTCVVFFLLLLGGCQVAPPVQLPPARKMPASFFGIADTTSMGSLPRTVFFKDPYLVNLIDTALTSNLDVLTAIQRIEAARADALLRRGALLPSLQAVASAGVDKYGDYTLNGVGNYDTNLSDNLNKDQRIPNPTPDYFLGLRSSWEIDTWGKLKNRRKSAYARLAASGKGQQLIITALTAEIAGRYYELLALDNQQEVIRKNIALQEKAVEMIEVQKMGGRATELAVQQFTAQLLRTKSLEFEIRQRINAAENQLNSLLGRFPQPIRRGKPIGKQGLPDFVAAGLPSDLLLRRPDIQQAEWGLQAAKADVEAARAAFLPSFTISPAIGFNAFQAALLFNPGSLAYGVLASVSAPIFQQNRLRAAYGRSVASNLEAYYAYQKTIVTAYQEVLTGLNGVGNFQQVYALQKQEVEVLTQAVSVSNDLFTAGYASYLEVITAQKTVLEAELALANTRKAQFLLVIDLYRALGGGWK